MCCDVLIALTGLHKAGDKCLKKLRQEASKHAVGHKGQCRQVSIGCRALGCSAEHLNASKFWWPAGTTSADLHRHLLVIPVHCLRHVELQRKSVKECVGHRHIDAGKHRMRGAVQLQA